MATQTKNFLSFIFRFAAEGWGEEARKKCKEIFGFARASPRARLWRVPARVERTKKSQATTRSARAKISRFATGNRFERRGVLSQIATSSEDSTTEGRAAGAPTEAKPPRALQALAKTEGGRYAK